MDIGALITQLLSASAITYILGWLAGRKKRKADLEGQNLTNIKAIIDIYKEATDDLKEQLDEITNRCIKLTTEIELLRRENLDTRKSNDSLTKQVEILRKENAGIKESNLSLEISNINLKNEIKELKILLTKNNKNVKN
jgi:hypothetical protein